MQCSDQHQQEQKQGELQLQETALLDRIKKGKKEVNVYSLETVENYGEWRASSIVSATHRNTEYRVQIRSLSKQQNFCSCPDWHNNQLGTCKHIEAVLHEIQRRNKTGKSSAQPLPFIYRGWEGRNPVIKLQRTDKISEELSDLLANFFDSAGRFTGQLPEDFYALQTRLYDKPGILLGEDAVAHAQSIQEKQNHALRKREIEEQIRFNGDRIPGINASLFPYQVEGVAFLASNGRALLADDMGLGKTLQSITAAWWLHRNANVEKVLIICPASLKSQWGREINKFTGLDSQIIQGNAEKRLAQYRTQTLFVIMNYETVIADLEAINTVVAPDLIILDEAQRLKNWRTKIASSIKLIASKYAFVLTGTPLENKLEELYSVMQIVDPNYLGPLWRFMADFHITDDKGKVLAYRNISELRSIIAPIMLRRNRAIVSKQLPTMSKFQIDVGMTNIQRDYHDAAMSAAGNLANIAAKRPLTPSESNRLMAALQQARMACNAAGLIDKESKGAPKLEELRRLFTEICLDGGDKVVVFSQWRLMTDMIETLAKDMQLGFVHLHGGVPSAKRGDMMKAFHEDDRTAIFIATDAGSTGLNLQCATTLINVDVPWTPAIIEQRNARIHRLGQTRNVRIISLISDNSYEQRVLQLVNSKQDLFNSAIVGDSENDVITVGGKGLSSLISELQADKMPASQISEPSVESCDDEAPMPGEEQGTSAQDLPVTPEQAPAEAPVTSAWLPDELTGEPQLEQLLVAVERQFAQRIDSIKAQQNQIIVVLDNITDADETFADQLQSDIPIVLLDPRSMRQLRKLNTDGWPSVSDSALQRADKQTEKQRSPWYQIANDKFQAAKLLNQQGVAGVLDLLSAAICAKISAIAEIKELITVDTASLELYTNTTLLEALSAQETECFIKVFNLSRLNTLIPTSLIDTLLTELEGFLTV